MANTRVTFRTISSRAIVARVRPEPLPTYQFSGKTFFRNPLAATISYTPPAVVPPTLPVVSPAILMTENGNVWLLENGAKAYAEGVVS